MTPNVWEPLPPISREMRIFTRRMTAIGFVLNLIIWGIVWWPLCVLMLAALFVWFTCRVLVGGGE